MLRASEYITQPFGFVASSKMSWQNTAALYGESRQVQSAMEEVATAPTSYRLWLGNGLEEGDFVSTNGSATGATVEVHISCSIVA